MTCANVESKPVSQRTDVAHHLLDAFEGFPSGQPSSRPKCLAGEEALHAQQPDARMVSSIPARRGHHPFMRVDLILLSSQGGDNPLQLPSRFIIVNRSAKPLQGGRFWFIDPCAYVESRG